MLFSPLHRALGAEPGPVTAEMLDQAITAQITETDDLDWKKAPPEARSLATSDVPKDVAAMANSGGGMIIYGIAETQKRATGRIDVGELDEAYERTYRSVVVSGIHPPIFGLGFYRLGDGDERALAVVVPASVDSPHLIYRNDYFGAPIRNDADTVWMRERQLEALYRVRLDDRRSAGRRLAEDYQQSADGLPILERAWMVGVARPRVAHHASSRMDRDVARKIFTSAEPMMLSFATSATLHPFESVAFHNPKPGLRRWVAAPNNPSDSTKWKEAWASVHFDGSVSLTAALGGKPTRDGSAAPNTIDTGRAETFVADLLALVKVASDTVNNSDYELHIGLEWDGSDPLVMQTVDQYGFPFGGDVPVRHFIPIVTTVRTNISPEAYLDQVRDIALDIVNQGGIQNLQTIHPADL